MTKTMSIWCNVKNGESFSQSPYKFNAKNEAELLSFRITLKKERTKFLTDREFIDTCFKKHPRKGYVVYEFTGQIKC